MAMARYLRSMGITPLHRYFEAVLPPLPGASVLSASRLEPLAPLSRDNLVELRAAPHAGCRSGSLRTSPKLIPEEGSPPGFGIV
jgi:hypothetical protein